VVDKLSGTSSRALKSQAVKGKLVFLGRDIFHTTPAEAGAYIKAAVPSIRPVGAFGCFDARPRATVAPSSNEEKSR
jgi:hypothetical protein